MDKLNMHERFSIGPDALNRVFAFNYGLFLAAISRHLSKAFRIVFFFFIYSSRLNNLLKRLTASFSFSLASGVIWARFKTQNFSSTALSLKYIPSVRLIRPQALVGVSLSPLFYTFMQKNFCLIPFQAT